MTRRTLILALVAGALLAAGARHALAKPSPFHLVKPVTVEGVECARYHERFDQAGAPAGLRAFVEARDPKSGDPLWKVKVYEIVYRPGLEVNAQDVYIDRLVVDGSSVVVVPQRGNLYRVDLEKHTVREFDPGKSERPKSARRKK